MCELGESEDCLCLGVSTLRSLRLGEGHFAIFTHDESRSRNLETLGESRFLGFIDELNLLPKLCC